MKVENNKTKKVAAQVSWLSSKIFKKHAPSNTLFSRAKVTKGDEPQKKSKNREILLHATSFGRIRVLFLVCCSLPLVLRLIDTEKTASTGGTA